MYDDPSSGEQWTGTRPQVSGAPVVAGAVIVALIVLVIVATVERHPGLVARLSQEYVRVMAGSLAPTLRPGPTPLERQLRNAGLPFDVRIGSIGPEFTMLGATISQIDGRQVGAWVYRARGSETVLVECFPGDLADLGSPDETRDDRTPRLVLFRKTTQTIVCWKEGALVYVLISTLPSEQVIALARRASAAGGSTPAEGRTLS